MGAAAGLYFRVLGPLTVERDGAPLDLGGPQRRLGVALLLAHATAVRLLRTALDRWRGPAFCDIPSPALEHRAAAVDELRMAALAECVDAQLADGRVAELGAELVRLVAEYPLHERFHGQLMTVYARTGRPADALTVYRELRRRMAAELGIEPSGELRDRHRQILSR